MFSATNLWETDPMTTVAAARAVWLSIPAKPEYITLGRLALTAIARLHDLPEETLGDLKLALTEACTNSVRHAYENGEGAVEILYELQPDRLAVEVSDEGPGFTPPDRELGATGEPTCRRAGSGSRSSAR